MVDNSVGSLSIQSKDRIAHVGNSQELERSWIRLEMLNRVLRRDGTYSLDPLDTAVISAYVNRNCNLDAITELRWGYLSLIECSKIAQMWELRHRGMKVYEIVAVLYKMHTTLLNSAKFVFSKTLTFLPRGTFYAFGRRTKRDPR